MCNSHLALVSVIFGWSRTDAQIFKMPDHLPSYPFLLCFPPLCIPLFCLKTNGTGFPQAIECVEVRGRYRSTMDFLVLSLWIQLCIHIGSSTRRPIATWYTLWCQKARNSRLRDTVCNNSTHLYWINGLKWTDQFSVLYIVDDHHHAFFFFPSVSLQKIRNDVFCSS